MKKFVYTQNNSGGYYDTPEWTGPDDRGGVEGFNVWVMAPTPTKANDLAQEYAGIYFYGVEKGIDCECCGDRWDRARGE